MKFEWEIVNQLSHGTQREILRRAKVRGGWLINTIYIDTEWRNNEEAITFMPDEKHEWKVDEDTDNVIEPEVKKETLQVKCKKRKK